MKHVGINNKGFTLVEILSVLVLISLLFGLAVPGVSKISQNMKNRSYNSKKSLIEKAGEMWGQDNKALLQSTKCNIEGFENNVSCYKATIYTLISDDYLESENIKNIEYKNPTTGNSILTKCVYVYKKNNRVYAKYDDKNDCGSISES